MTGLFDLQVNGYAGVDFNADDLGAEDLHRACEGLRDDGMVGVLATVITDLPERMVRRLDRLAELRERDPLVRQIVAGIHVEGPFLNPTPGYAGAHPAAAMRQGDVALAERLLDAARGLVKLVTLAPECDPSHAVTRMCAGRGIAVAAGHTDASLAELGAAIDAGLRLFTHLGNGCPALLPRHDNIVLRALSLSARLWTCFVGDGVHVPYFALASYLKVTTLERAVIVSDATAAAGMGPGFWRLGGQEITVGEDLVARGQGRDHLVGSTTTLATAARRLQEDLGLSAEAVTRLCAQNPRRAVGL